MHVVLFSAVFYGLKMFTNRGEKPDYEQMNLSFTLMIDQLRIQVLKPHKLESQLRLISFVASSSKLLNQLCISISPVVTWNQQ